MIIREFRLGDEEALHDVFFSSVHEIASKDYTEEQLNAWAPREYDPDRWAERMRGISPFVVEIEGRIVAYADLQPNGYIDHFFVSPSVARQGIGSALMRHILEVAGTKNISELKSDVSKTAHPLFEKFGFYAVYHQSKLIEGVVVPNICMRKHLQRL